VAFAATGGEFFGEDDVGEQVSKHEIAPVANQERAQAGGHDRSVSEQGLGQFHVRQ